MMKQSTNDFARRLMSSKSPLQSLAFLACFLFGLAMIANISMGGEATWFWYATLMHHGVRLYADMHLALQPWYVLETDAWMTLTGRTCIAYEGLAVIHVFLLCLGILLVLRESPWPDWKKAPVFAAAFFIDIYFVAIRFDDFHVVNDILVLYAIVVLLRLFHARTTTGVMLWAVVAGVLSGISFTNRSTDGGMLLLASCFCVPFLARQRRFWATLVFGVSSALAILLVVHLTGDTYSDYLSSAVLHAAAAKGGTGTVLHGPLVAMGDNFRILALDDRALTFVLVVLAAWWAKRYWRDNARSVFWVAFAAACSVMVLSTIITRHTLLQAAIRSLNTPVQIILYPLCLWVLARFFWSRRGAAAQPSDPREILVFIAAATLISAALSQVNGTDNSTISMMVLFLLATYWIPKAGTYRWWGDAFAAIALFLACAGCAYKAAKPYDWGIYTFKPLFKDRVTYQHPIYGPMYLDAGLLQSMSTLCSEINHDGPQTELLTLPYSYPNYFCGIPPWRGYVQTWYDTTTPEVIQTLMDQLKASPPRWIVYERQLQRIKGHELEYHNGRPIMHRYLDDLIVKKIADGEWKLVDRKDDPGGDGWFLIQTHP